MLPGNFSGCLLPFLEPLLVLLNAAALGLEIVLHRIRLGGGGWGETLGAAGTLRWGGLLPLGGARQWQASFAFVECFFPLGEFLLPLGQFFRALVQFLRALGQASCELGKSLLLLSEEFFLPAKQQLALCELLFTFPLLQLLDPSRDGFVPARQRLP